MRLVLALAAISSAAAFSAAQAAPELAIRGAAARLVVVPEDRSDIAVQIIKTNPRLPLRVSRLGGSVIINGDIGHRAHACHTLLGRRSVGVWGRGDIAYDDMPSIVVHMPMNVRVSAGDAVFGTVGRSASLLLENRGCGDWVVANVKGRMRLTETGSGDAHVGSAGGAEIYVAGSGVVEMRDIRGGLIAVSTGAGDINAASVNGPLNVRIAGSGGVRAASGQVSDLNADIAGSGDVSFGGVAQKLTASVAGSGDVNVAQVTGPVNKRVFGSGEVTVGR